MSVHSLYMLTTVVFACFILSFVLEFCASILYAYILMCACRTLIKVFTYLLAYICAHVTYWYLCVSSDEVV